MHHRLVAQSGHSILSQMWSQKVQLTVEEPFDRELLLFACKQKAQAESHRLGLLDRDIASMHGLTLSKQCRCVSQNSTQRKKGLIPDSSTM